jgi:hypothetical protein
MAEKPDYDVGDAAEAVFASWCAQANIIASPPQKDRGGWDFHLSLPYGNHLDLIDAPPVQTCYVQVKGHLGADGSPPNIKLSNWHRMISQATPWFVCVVLLDRDAAPQSCVLVHIGEAWVTRARKRIWENLAGEKAPLHDLTMACTWNDSEVLSAMHGRQLLAAIRSHVGDQRAYFEAKQSWHDDAGVDGGKHLLSITWDREVSDQVLCDFALGKRKSIGVTKLEEGEIRFGIPIHRNTWNDVVIETPGPRSIGTTRLRVKRAKIPRDTVEVELDTLSAKSIFPFLSSDYHRIRLVAPLISVEIHPRRPSGQLLFWNFGVDADEEVSLYHLERAARTVRALREEGAEIEALIPPDGRSIPLPIDYDATLNMTGAIDELVEAACNAGQIARVFGLDLDGLLVTPASLVEDAKGLSVLAMLYSGNTSPTTMTIQDPDAARFDGKSLGRVIAIGAWIGRRCLLQCTVVTGLGRASEDSSRLSLEGVRLTQVERIIIDLDRTTPAEADARVAEMLRHARAELEREGHLLVAVKNDPQ